MRGLSKLFTSRTQASVYGIHIVTNGIRRICDGPLLKFNQNEDGALLVPHGLKDFMGQTQGLGT
jgi:hypothetical protein